MIMKWSDGQSVDGCASVITFVSIELLVLLHVDTLFTLSAFVTIHRENCQSITHQRMYTNCCLTCICGLLSRLQAALAHQVLRQHWTHRGTAHCPLATHKYVIQCPAKKVRVKVMNINYTQWDERALTL